MMLARGENPVLGPGDDAPGRRALCGAGALAGGRPAGTRPRPARPARSTSAPRSTRGAPRARRRPGARRGCASRPRSPCPASPSRTPRHVVVKSVQCALALEWIVGRGSGPGSSSSSATRSTCSRAGSSSATCATHASSAATRELRPARWGIEPPGRRRAAPRAPGVPFGVLDLGAARRGARASATGPWPATRTSASTPRARFRALAAELGLEWGDARRAVPHRLRPRGHARTGRSAAPRSSPTGGASGSTPSRSRRSARRSRASPTRSSPSPDGGATVAPTSRPRPDPRALAGARGSARRRRATCWSRRRPCARPRRRSASRSTTCCRGRTRSSATSRRSACATHCLERPRRARPPLGAPPARPAAARPGRHPARALAVPGRHRPARRPHAAARVRPRLVYTVHNTFPSFSTPTRILNGLTYPLDDADLAVSTEVHETIWPRLRDRTEVVVHGVLLDEVRAELAHRDDDARRARDRAADEIVVGTIANFRAQKDYPNLLAAARLLLDRGVAGPHRRGRPGSARGRDARAPRPARPRRPGAAARPAATTRCACSPRATSSPWRRTTRACRSRSWRRSRSGSRSRPPRSAGSPRRSPTGSRAMLVPPKQPEALADAIATISRRPDAAAPAWRPRRRVAGERFDIRVAVARIEADLPRIASMTGDDGRRDPSGDRRRPRRRSSRCSRDVARPRAPIPATRRCSRGSTRRTRSGRRRRGSRRRRPTRRVPGAHALGVRRGAGRVVRAVRAVDTATHPGLPGPGHLHPAHAARARRAAPTTSSFVFNTPNDQSRPGYLKMGWQVVGRLPTAVRPTGLARHPAHRDAPGCPPSGGRRRAPPARPPPTCSPTVAARRRLLGVAPAAARAAHPSRPRVPAVAVRDARCSATARSRRRGGVGGRRRALPRPPTRARPARLALVRGARTRRRSARARRSTRARSPARPTPTT